MPHHAIFYQTTYAGLYSTLIVFELRSPEGSDPSGPSPFCSNLTQSSNSETARLRHTAGQISNLESASSSLLVALEQLGVRTTTVEEDFAGVDAVIEDSVSSSTYVCEKGGCAWV
jgi:hypothetical protein